MTRDRHDFAPLSNTALNRGAQHKAKRRRRSSHGDEDEQDASQLQGDIDPREALGPDRSSHDPFYVAGHDPLHTLPSANFPHHDPRAKWDLDTPLVKQLPTTSDVPTIQQQHAAVMATILHLSLQKGDYMRAGEAFSLLLRSTSTISTIDLRTNSSWAIGAEILLQGRHEQRVSNFAALKNFYEQLILQYPHAKRRPRVVDDRTFYPALFSLLIYEATTHSSQAMRSIKRKGRESASGNDDSESDPEDLEDDDDVRLADTEARLSIKRSELEAARSIARRMDELTVSPPYDRAVPLLRLRGMISLWIADVLEDLERLVGGSDDERDAEDAAPTAAVLERGSARTRFRRVLELGGDVDDAALDKAGR